MQARSRSLLAGIILLHLCLCGGALAARPLYHIEDIGPSRYEFGGPPPRINDSGQVIIVDDPRLLRYTDGIGLEQLDVPAAHPTGIDINNRGQVVGRTVQAGQSYAFRYSDGAGVDALVPLVWTSGEYSLFLNDHGQFAGSTGEHGFLYTDGAGVTTLPHKYVWDLNNRGDILAGDYEPSPTSPRGRYLFTEARGWEDIGPRFFNAVGAGALNDIGQVAGYRAPNPGGASLRVVNPVTGHVLPFGTPQGSRLFISGLNNLGQVVGVGWGVGLYLPFIASEATGLLNLNTLIDPSMGWDLTVASDINERGQIVGIGRLNNQYRTFRLTPTAIPEPGTLALVAVGLVPLVRRRMI